MVTFGDLNDVLVILKDHGPDVDLSKKWVTIEYEDAAPQSVVITLNAKGGRYITKGDKIQKWDRIYVQLTDRNGDVLKDVFHVKRREKIRKPGRGLLLKLHCPHESSNLWTRTVSLPLRRTSGMQALNQILSQIEFNKGTNDPFIEIPATFDTVNKIGNRLDPNTQNNYIFESVKLKTAVDEIKRIEQEPVEGGGSNEAVYVRFKSKYDHGAGTGLGVVYLQAFEQGYKDNGVGGFVNTPSVTLHHNEPGSATRPNTLELDSKQDPEQATNLVAIGDKNSGSFPTEYQKYVAAKDVFNNAKDWLTATEYKKGHLVRDAGLTYEAVTDHTSSAGNRPPSSDWIARTFTKPDAWNSVTSYVIHALVRHNDIAYKNLVNGQSNNEPGGDTNTFWKRVFFVPTVDYSPLTKDKVQYWLNALAGAKHHSTNNAKTLMVDPNVYIRDTKHPRTEVDFIDPDPANIPSELKDGSDILDGFRMLAINRSTGAESGSGAFSGSDKNGVSFAGNVVEFIDPDHNGTGEWVVMYDTGNDFEVFDWYEGESWTKFPCEGVGSYLDADSVCQVGSRATVWRKGSYGLSEIPLVGKFGVFITGKQFECVHSVKWDSSNSRVDMGNEKITPEDGTSTSAVFIKSAPLDTSRTFPFYVGLNFCWPWPRTSLGSPFGSVSIGEKIKHRTFDANNMNYTHTLIREWFGPQVEDFFPIQGFLFFEKLRFLDILLANNPEIAGDYSMGIWVSDRHDNVYTIEYTHGRNDIGTPQDAALAKRKVYQGVPGVSAFFAAEEPEILDVFDVREYRRGGIYTKDSFDNQGRYLGLRSRFLKLSEMKLSIDAWRMSKPLVATNIDEPNVKPIRNIEPQKIRKDAIISYAQLKQYVLGLARWMNFERQEFPVKRSGRNNIAFGDPVYYEDAEAIDETTDSLPNTIKAVNDKTVHSLSKPKKGPGGWVTTHHLITRLFP